MKVLIVNNIGREGPGLLEEILEENEIESYTYEYQKDKAFPSPGDYGAIFVFGGPDSANDETDKMIEERAKELSENTGGHIFHSKWNGKKTPHISVSRIHRI
ncbi:MAG: hypothetical protein GKC00_02425 [Candidatus Methanofastidiosa archaeon]|nr:hypothetical protein [Candidatus Methanofastidiosa archaeon]